MYGPYQTCLGRESNPGLRDTGEMQRAIRTANDVAIRNL